MYKKAVVIIAMICIVFLGVNTVQAQQSATPNPLDTIPEKMPFDIPYGTPISLERAAATIVATVAEAKRHDWELNVAVVDTGGNLVAF